MKADTQAPRDAGAAGKSALKQGLVLAAIVLGLIGLLCVLPLLSTPTPGPTATGIFGLHWSIELSIWIGLGCIGMSVLLTVVKPEFLGGE